MRTKYVDDTTAIEIIPRNSTRMLDLVVREIHDYCMEHKMILNLPKMVRTSITAMRPIGVGNQEEERVITHKLSGVIISDDLKWNTHVEHVIASS